MKDNLKNNKCKPRDFVEYQIFSRATPLEKPHFVMRCYDIDDLNEEFESLSALYRDEFFKVKLTYQFI